MHSLRRVLLSIGVSACAFVSCHRENPVEAGTGPSYFPNTVGDRWTYVVFDSIRHIADTVRVQVTSEGTLPSRVPPFDREAVNVWEYTYRDHADTQYVNLLHDTVNVYNGEISHPYFIIPFQVGRQWGSSYGLGGDSTTVVMKDSIVVPAGKFKSSFLIRRHQYTIGPVTMGDIDRWFVPYVGSVWIHQEYTRGLVCINVTWVLISYEFPT